MKITITLELDNPCDLDAEEIEKDIRMGENQIGWNYDYKIVSIDVDIPTLAELKEKVKEMEQAADRLLQITKDLREAVSIPWIK